MLQYGHFMEQKDRNVPVAGSREMIKAIKNLDGNPLYTEHPRWRASMRDDRTDTILKWLFEHLKLQKQIIDFRYLHGSVPPVHCSTFCAVVCSVLY
jgi:hypothetical protein